MPIQRFLVAPFLLKKDSAVHICASWDDLELDTPRFFSGLGGMSSREAEKFPMGLGFGSALDNQRNRTPGWSPENKLPRRSRGRIRSKAFAGSWRTAARRLGRPVYLERHKPLDTHTHHGIGISAPPVVGKHLDLIRASIAV